MNQFLSGLVIGLAGSVLVALTLGGVVWTRFNRRRTRSRRALQRLRATARRGIARHKATAEGAQRLAEVGTLTGGLAHEIKNPLSTVLLNLQLLQEDLDRSDPAYSRFISRLNIVVREAARLRDILDDFLRFAGKLELRRQSVDLCGLLEELVDFFAPQTQLHRVQLRYQPPSGPLVVAIDPRLIKQAVLNLMLNALQAMPNGGELILGAREEGGRAIVDVIDTGSGIAPDTLGKIFQAYYSTKKGGTGLGLAMAKRIVEEHGGELAVTSVIGKGSDFSLRLPMSRTAPIVAGPAAG